MPILDLQVQMRELGRIRMGEKRKGKKGSFPAKLSTWRLTSPSKRLLVAVAEKYGGSVTEWSDERSPGKQWQVTTNTSILDVTLPPGDVGSSWYEFWTADGCKRRCDGKVNNVTGEPCQCPPDLADRAEAAKGTRPTACKPVTRLNVILNGIPEVGVWRLETHGWNAAKEIAAIGTVCELATKSNRVIPAKLRLEQRTAKKPGQARSDFVVPVLDVEHAFDDILRALGLLDEDAIMPELAAPARPAALPEGRPDLPRDPAFQSERVGETAVSSPVPPVPGPPPALDAPDDDDEVVEAEIVEDTEHDDRVGPGSPRSAGSPDAAAVASSTSSEPSVAPAPAGPSDDSPGEVDTANDGPPEIWSAGRWRDEVTKAGLTLRGTRDAALEICKQHGIDKKIATYRDFVDPRFSEELKVWLLLHAKTNKKETA